MRGLQLHFNTMKNEDEIAYNLVGEVEILIKTK